jgi:hypothetical protein
VSAQWGGTQSLMSGAQQAVGAGGQRVACGAWAEAGKKWGGLSPHEQ